MNRSHRPGPDAYGLPPRWALTPDEVVHFSELSVATATTLIQNNDSAVHLPAAERSVSPDAAAPDNAGSVSATSPELPPPRSGAVRRATPTAPVQPRIAS